MTSGNYDFIIHYSARCHYYHVSQDLRMLLSVWVLNTKIIDKILRHSAILGQKFLSSSRRYLFFKCRKIQCNVLESVVFWFHWCKSTRYLLFRNVFPKKKMNKNKSSPSFNFCLIFSNAKRSRNFIGIFFSTNIYHFIICWIEFSLRAVSSI
jgi:hypothetical protein